VKNASLADRVGGLLMIGFDGLTVHEAPADFIADLAGAILFSRNLCDAAQSRALVDGLQSARAPGALPLLIGVDQEGGTVSRIDAFGTTTPSAMSLGASGDPVLTQSVYSLIGDELAALGFTMDFAPVADVNTDPRNPVIGVRAFGARAEIVAQHVTAAIRGLRRAGISSVAKHFPGHGDTTVDSHLALPVIGRGAAQLRCVDMLPFCAAIAAGVDAVMVGHVAVPAIEPAGIPATLSRKVIGGLLREELGYDGVVCTDCMEMGAISSLQTHGNAAVLAIAAGADLVLYSRSLDAATAARDALRAAVLDGTLDEAQVARSLQRTASLRERIVLQPADPAAIARVGSSEHRAQARAAAARGITLVRDPLRSVPLRAGAGERVLVVHFYGKAAAAESRTQLPTALGEALSSGPARIHEQARSADPAGHEYKQLLMAAGSAAAIVCVTYRAAIHPLQVRAIDDLVLFGKPVVVVVAREPYDADLLPAGAAVIASYGDDAGAMSAVADVLLGRAQARGTVPVPLTGAAL
jgi:beta-N-acetylhexosaminidase